MTTPHTHYFPTLKGRAGELQALQNVPTATRAILTPILELPASDDADDDTVIAEVDKLTGKLAAHWSAGYPLIIDARVTAGVLRTGREVVLDLHDAIRDDVDAVPVIGFGAPGPFLAAVASIVSTDQNGVCIRLSPDDMEDLTSLATGLTALLTALSVTAADVDLVLDVGPVEPRTVAVYAALVTSVVATLPTLPDWRSLVVLSGAFPQTLAAVTPNVLATIPRADAQLWQRLAARPGGRTPSYGDYAVSHPIMAAAGPYRGAPNLRYTSDTEWYVLKGKLNTPQGNKTFFGICRQMQTMAGSPMDPPAYSWGDQNFGRCAASSGGPGGGTQWKAWSTSHHLAKVVDRLATHGAP